MIKGWWNKLNRHRYKTSHLIIRDTQVDKIDKVTLMCLMVIDECTRVQPMVTTQQNLPGASQSAHGHTRWLPENWAVPSSINVYTHLKSSVNIPALSLLQVGLAKSSPASQRAHLHQTKGTICNTDIRISEKKGKDILKERSLPFMLNLSIE